MIMIKSMTAFSRKDQKVGDMALSWEIRTVNSRHLDISLHLPEMLMPYEHKFKEVIQKNLGRGRVDLKLTLQTTNLQEQEKIIMNQAKVKSLLSACSQLKSLTNKSATLSAMEILQWPGVMEKAQTNQVKNNESFEASKSLLKATLDDLIAMRETEGGRLLEMIKSRGESIVTIVASVKERRVEVIKALREKVMSKISELALSVDKNRLEQELVYHAQRLDVDEELDRLGAHIDEVNAVLIREEPIGRRLDFLMQELNREANTLASKSNDAETTKSAVELKVLIEQMREQCLNIE
jgi:uncharacterized protein (TIGR00255 family)